MTPPDRPAAPLRVFARLKRIERRHVADVLRTETVGGALLIVFALARAAVGELPLARLLRHGQEHRRRTAPVASGPVAGGLGRRLPARVLLPGGRDRAQARAPGRRAVGSARRGASGRLGVLRHGGADRGLPGGQRRARARRRRLGRAHRHRHRVRPRRAGRRRAEPAVGAARVPAHPGGRRRPRRDHHHRGRVHRQDRHCRAGDRGGPARRVLCGAAEADHQPVAQRAARPGHLDRGARQRHPRDGGRRGHRPDAARSPARRRRSRD